MRGISESHASIQNELDALRLRVSELTKRESALRSEAELYARVLDTMKEMVVVKRADLSVAYANRAYCAFYGKTREELTGFEEDTFPGVDLVGKHCFEDRYTLATANEIRSPADDFADSEGRVSRFAAVRTPLLDASGKPDMVLCVLRSAVDEDLEVEQTLKLIEAHNHALMRAIPDTVFRISDDGHYLDFSVTKDNVAAQPPSIFIGKRVQDVVPDLAPQILALASEAHRTQRVQTAEFSRMEQGKRIHYESRVTVSGPHETVHVVRDITEEKQLEETLRESEARFRMLVEQSLVGICVIQDGKVVYASPKFAEMHGYTVQELLAMETPSDTIATGHDAIEAAYTSIFRDPEPGQGGALPASARMSYRARRKDGSLFDIESYIGRTLWDGRPAVVGTVLDVTEQKKAEEEQRRMQDELLRAQAAVLAELSTPLIPINDRVMVMPLIGAMDATRASRVQERLLDGITKSRAKAAILDITGMPSVNADAAAEIVRCAQAVRLLGAEVVLTGIRPEVAQTLTTLDVDLRGVVTRGTLQAGIAYAMGASGAAGRGRPSFG